MALLHVDRLIEQCALAYGLNDDGLCAWCGEPVPIELPGPWCSMACAVTFDENHVWRVAQPAAMVRTARRCVRCRRTAMLVHHDPPVGAAGYVDGCQHHQERLHPMCNPDHAHAHRILRSTTAVQLSMFRAA